MFSRRPLVRRALAGGTAVFAIGALALGGLPAAGAASPASATAAQNAVYFLATQQQSSGDIGVSGLETREAALAIAENAQTTAEWNPTEGRNAVLATQNSGHNPIDAIAAYVQNPSLAPGDAARTIVLTTAPLGYDPTNFAGVNLVAKVASGANSDGSYGGPFALDDTVYSALADRLTTGTVPAATVAFIRAGQNPDGGWNFSGVPDGTGTDAGFTAKALQALIAGGVSANDPTIRAGVASLARTMNANGSWDAFGVPNDTSATALAIVGLNAVGLDTTNAAWRNAADPSKAGVPYVNPDSYLIGIQQPDGSIPGGFNTVATSQAVQALLRSWLPIATPGYQVVRANGHVTGLGGAPSNSSTWNGVVGAAATNSGHGTWLGLGNGGVITEGDAGFYGSMGGTKLAKPMVGIAATPSGKGYWMVAGDGGIFTFGDAQFFGGLGALKLDQPIVAMASTPTGRGYTLFASDGGVFAFGDARFLGSMGGIKLNKPVVGGTSATNGAGYWMVASDGGIFNFGTAPFAGSLGALKLDKPIAGMQHTGDGQGYWLVGADGGVFTLGGAPFLGAALGDPSPVVAFDS